FKVAEGLPVQRLRAHAPGVGDEAARDEPLALYLQSQNGKRVAVAPGDDRLDVGGRHAPPVRCTWRAGHWQTAFRRVRPNFRPSRRPSPLPAPRKDGEREVSSAAASLLLPVLTGRRCRQADEGQREPGTIACLPASCRAAIA